MTTTENVTDDQIKQLRIEAGEAGDERQVAICDIALGRPRADAGEWSQRPIEDARDECARVIANAEAAR